MCHCSHRILLFDLIDLSFLISDSLLFATTNHIERLDPALSRPGRMDVWVNFTNATKWQAEGIFKCFFPSRPSASSSDESAPVDASQKNPPGSKRKASAHAVPVLEESEIAQLAKRFADSIPEMEMSVCAHVSSHSRLTFPFSRIRFSFSFNFRLPAYKVICSRIRHAHENAWRRLPIGARHSLHFVFVLIIVDIHVRKDTTRA